MSVSEAFNAINHKFLIVKLVSYGLLELNIIVNTQYVILITSSVNIQSVSYLFKNKISAS